MHVETRTGRTRPAASQKAGTLADSASAAAPSAGEQRLAAILDGVGEPFYALDREWRLTFFNLECERYFGRGRGEVLGRVLWDLFPGLAETALGGRFRAAMQSGERVSFESASVVKPGHWFEFRIFPTPEGMGVAFRNIDERREAERTLRTYGLLIERMTEGVSVSNENGIIVYTNPAEDEMFGYARGELVGRHVGVQNAYEPDENRRRVDAVIEQLKTVGAWEGEWLNRRKDGSQFVTISHITAVDIEGRQHFLCVQRDVTAAKQAEAALRKREAELARVQHIGQVGGLELDLAENARNRRSPEYLALHGLPPERALEGHTDWLARVHPEDRAHAEERFRAAISGEARDYTSEYRIVRASDGEVRWIYAKGQIERDPDGTARRLVGAHIDITDRKVAEDHQRLLIHELNHRVKNTLATVQSIAAQTLRHASSPSHAREAFESRLMALSRAHDVLTRENWEGAELRTIVAEAIGPYSNVKSDRIDVDGPDLRLAPRMALALAMALQELATNAVKYGALSDQTGRIAIDWSVDAGPSPPRLRLRWAESGGPPVRRPERRGFGSRLIERSLAQDLDGAATIAFEPEGVICIVDAPLP